MRKLLVGFISILLVFFTGCSEPTDEESLYDIQKTLNQIEDYSCVAEISIKGNKKPEKYKVKHTFKKPNKYISEILEPKNNKGNMTIYNGKQAYLYSPQINQLTILKDYKQLQDEMLFIGYFLRILITTENPQIMSDTLDEKEYMTVKAEIPGNNMYRKYEQIWIDKKTHLPYKLIIVDDKGETLVEVKYSEVKYNIGINDDKFNMELK
ncbi:hypothetical protein CLPU_4c02310 [Gottschalkia purinilytica]|uniref:Outer membrane lipoprotein-sorting protein n=1 Tax=Gottschalkia purinilytica TaxID=1503 RepID=A0A0L0WCP3_GOTPU|nr:outer membrane lipoprotein carrier protein LolA [Gottschalkia purinilytica]KNF09185.1 hypothetical protein CLPU_4c02310 [Gottschalkia purinilytica]